jgi:hypothetical protein
MRAGTAAGGAKTVYEAMAGTFIAADTANTGVVHLMNAGSAAIGANAVFISRLCTDPLQGKKRIAGTIGVA